MTIRAKNRILAGLAAVAVVAFAVTVLPMIASSNGSAVRDINIVVRGMAFYVDNNTEANPIITVRAGERVRVRVRSEDAGMRHDFTIKAWTVSTKMLEAPGAEDVVEFRVPDARGRQTYQCTPHPQMMTGTVRVE
jgi:plastocyanin